MKKKSLKFKEKIGSSVNIKYLFAILVIIIFRTIYYKNVLIAQEYSDSATYIYYSFRDLFSLKFTSFRTPGYPFIIRIFYYILGDKDYLVGVVLFQIIISLISLIFMYKAFLLIINSETLVLLITMFYGCSPAVMSWDTSILTESLSLSGTVILIYFLIKYIKFSHFSYGILAIFWAFMIIWIKPSLLVFCGGLLAFFILQYFQEKSKHKQIIILIICSLFTFALIGLYSYFYSLIYGTFSISSQGPRHLLAACLASGIYSSHPDINMVQNIEQIYSANNWSIAYDTTTPVMNLFGSNLVNIQQEVQTFCKVCIKNDFGGYITYLFKTVIQNINIVYGGNYNCYIFENPISAFIIEIQNLLFTGLKIGHIYLIGIIELFFSVSHMVNKKRIPWYHFGVAGFIILIFVSVYLGTYAEFMRSSIHVLPVAYLGIGLLINEIIQYKKEGGI